MAARYPVLREIPPGKSFPAEEIRAHANPLDSRTPEVILNTENLLSENVKTIILDVDGTLMDSNYLHVEAWSQAFEEVGKRPVRAKIHREIGKGSDKLIPEFVEENEGAEITDDINSRHAEVYAEIQDKGHPLPGSEDLISHLHESGYAVWLATSADADEMENTIEELDADDKIAGIVSSSEADGSKPAPDIFDLTLKRAEATADEVVAIGDSIWDIQAAKDAGISTIAVLTGGAFSREELEEAGAIAVFEDCRDLLESNVFQNRK